MHYNLIRQYDNPDTGRHNGFIAYEADDPIVNCFDERVDYRIYVAM